MDTWEYRGVDTVISAWKDTGEQVLAFLDHLNQLGAEGWELVTESVIRTKGHNSTQMPILLFKRRVQNSEAVPTGGHARGEA